MNNLFIITIDYRLYAIDYIENKIDLIFYYTF